MSQALTIELELPPKWRRLRMAPPLQARLQELLDKQDQLGKLSAKERREARALTELADLLSLMRLRAKVATRKRAS